MPSDSKPDDAREQRIRHLENEVALLSAENDRLRGQEKARIENPRNTATLMAWLLKGSWGASLVDRGGTLTSRLEAWNQGDPKPPIREGIDFATGAILRFTRIGVFRGILASVAAIGATILAVGQIIILDNQNAMVKEHKRIAAMDKYVYFMAEEETARRLLGTAFDHWFPMESFDLTINSRLSEDALREGVLKAIPNKSSVDEIIAKCGLSLYPVGNPIEYGELALSKLENGKVMSARFSADELRRWMKKAADSCADRMNLMKQLREDMGKHAELVHVDRDVER